MDKKEYLKVGNLIIVGDTILVKREVYDDGLTFGDIYKNEEAYNNDWDTVCYIPEAGFMNCERNEDGLYIDPDGYTHNDLLALCSGNREMCDAFFQSLIWACPETYMGEWDEIDYSYYYQFIRQDAEVWWNDPDSGFSSGKYTVIDVPFSFDANGELVDEDTFNSGAIITIGNGVSEAEVPYYELTPVYPDLKPKE